MIQYTPRPGSKGNWNEARRECLALMTMLNDEKSFAAFLALHGADAVTGLCEDASAEVALLAERVDGQLVLTAIERDSASLEA